MYTADRSEGSNYATVINITPRTHGFPSSLSPPPSPPVPSPFSGHNTGESYGAGGTGRY